jgi:hypothetical protein
MTLINMVVAFCFSFFEKFNFLAKLTQPVLCSGSSTDASSGQCDAEGKQCG